MVKAKSSGKGGSREIRLLPRAQELLQLNDEAWLKMDVAELSLILKSASPEEKTRIFSRMDQINFRRLIRKIVQEEMAAHGATS